MIHITMELLTQGEKVVVAGFKAEALEAESSKPRKELIAAMDEGNFAKDKVKVLIEELRVEKLLTVQKDEQLHVANQKVKIVVAKAVQAFQLTKKYNIVIFSWYYKGFELLWRYLLKHMPGVDMENLDFRQVDKEMKANEAA